MKIEIIDDDLQFASKLETLISPHFKDDEITINDRYDTNNISDIYFLDIDMPKLDGLTIAKDIYQNKDNAIIIFVSNREDLVFDAMKLFPYYFIRKQYLQDELEILFYKLQQNKDHQIKIKYQNRDINIHTKDIVYLEKNGQYLDIITTSHTFSVRHSIKEMLNLLPKRNFGIVSQGIIVNFKYVKEENSKCVTMDNGYTAYYSRGRRKQFLNKYLEYISN